MAQDAPPQTLCQKETPTAISGHVVKLLNYQFGMLKSRSVPLGNKNVTEFGAFPLVGTQK